ncbi:hypothetical protein DRO58_07890 [Candidatus Bathyarchaeota archaeon]|nr:MAG: hypothetical protein DRO58_07890 [Candidatus Bathyarchaeota archaeon]
MTPRERVLAALKGEPVDKIPFTIYDILVPKGKLGEELKKDGVDARTRRLGLQGEVDEREGQVYPEGRLRLHGIRDPGRLGHSEAQG